MSACNKFAIIIPPQDISVHPQCLLLIASGDRRAFEWLYKNYCKKIFEYSLLIVNDRTAAEDIVQDIFVKIWIKRSMLTSVGNFNSWLYTMVRNHILDGFDRKKTQQQYIEHKLSSGESNECPHMLHFKREVKGLVQQAVKKLPPQQQLIFMMQREQGMKRSEVASVLRLSPNTVKNHDQRTTRFIREFVKKQF